MPRFRFFIPLFPQRPHGVPYPHGRLACKQSMQRAGGSCQRRTALSTAESVSGGRWPPPDGITTRTRENYNVWFARPMRQGAVAQVQAMGENVSVIASCWSRALLVTLTVASGARF
jgi:hypothetical protein